MQVCDEKFVPPSLDLRSLISHRLSASSISNKPAVLDCPILISLVVYWSLPTNHEVPASIPGSAVGIFPEGEDSRGDHGLGRLVEFRFKGHPGTTSTYITTHIIGTT